MGNFQEARQFLDTLYGRYFQNRDGLVELRFIGQDSISKFLPKGELTEAAWPEIIALNRTHHVFIGVNPRPLNQAKKQDDIKDVVCLWADIDGKDFEGGKEEALQTAQGFALPPSIMVDSGHGYHCYWVLSEPILGLTETRRLQFKKVLAGLVKELGADRSKVHLDACLRFPGTLNMKGANITECRLMNLSDKAYALADLTQFTDASYEEPQFSKEPFAEFGTKTKEIRRTNPEDAIEDVGKLEISAKIKKLIITGSLPRDKKGDRSRSARDFAIICGLIFFDYDYKTISSIFFNPFLGCSNRILQEGEDKLKWDVRSALDKVKNRATEGTPQTAAIMSVKTQKMNADEKRLQVNAIITKDLLTGPEPAGVGFRDSETLKFYFFDNESKELMNLEGIDFYCYMRERFGISLIEFDERKDAVRTAIWAAGNKAVSHKFAYWDKGNFNLYVSDHDNGIYKLDGEKTVFCPNGTDGVFFEYNPLFTPFKFVDDKPVALYFEVPKPEKTIEAAGAKMDIPAGGIAGLDLDRYYNGGSLLKRFVIDRASFATTEDNPLSPEDQELVLLLYIYSQLFESIMQEKPIACLVGIKESGKSFLATSIGKLFFGDKFESRSLPKTAHDLAVVMAGMPYFVIDNLDSKLDEDILNVLCAAATGVTESNRALFTDSDVVSFTLHCFLAITSREPKFTRDDFVSRLLLFNTQKIDDPISRSELVESLMENRSAIMTEILVNANSIIKRLKAMARLKKALGANWPPVPEGETWSRAVWQPVRCISRNADWETWGRAVCGWRTGFAFRTAMVLMNQGKDKFALEDNYLYQTLHYLLYEKNILVRNESPQGLYNLLLKTAEEMQIAGFDRAVKSAVSMAKRLHQIIGELKQEMDVQIVEGRSRKKEYTFKAFGDDRPDPPKEIRRPTDEEATADVIKRAKKGKNGPEVTIVKGDFDPEPKPDPDK